MVKFIKINSCRYISNNRSFSLIKNHDYYQILMNSKLPTWSFKFSSVECAEKFLNSHDYVHASIDHMPMSADDIEFIIDMYGFNNVGHNKWSKKLNDRQQIDLTINPNEPKISVFKRTKGKLFSDAKATFDKAIDAIDYLDSVDSSVQIVKCSSIEELKTAITAAGKQTRDITKNLVRVKSSNLWAYAMDIKDRHDKTGTLYIQFKGKNGGPGDIYQYLDVLITDWRKLISSPSAGHAFWTLIRNRYMYRKLTGDKRGKLRNAIN